MPVCGPSLEGLQTADLFEVLSNKNIPDSRVIWKNGETLTEQLDRSSALQLSRQLSQGYVDAKLIDPNRPGQDVFIIYSENQVIGFPNLLSVVAGGGIVATCPWQATVHELLYRIEAVRPKAIICSKKSLSNALDAKSQTKQPFEIIVQDTSRRSVCNHATGHSYISDREYPWKIASNDFEKDRASVLVFSSGTTGSPKGVRISQRNIVSMIKQIELLLSPKLSPLDKLVMAGVLDSAHVAGMFVNNFLCLALGFTNILVPGTNTSLLLKTLVTQQVNIMFSVPPIFSRLVLEPGYAKADLQHLKYVVTGAAPTTSALQMAVSEPMKSDAYCQQGWGMTELTFLPTMPEPGVCQPWESVGRVLAGNRIKICDEEGNEMPPNVHGEIYVSGPTVCRGYYNASESYHNIGEQPEWFRTGDLGYFDDTGYLYISGRNKDLIKYNGAQVSPLELEDVIREHPKIADVAVVGTQLDDGNELPTAFVVLKEQFSSGDSDVLRREIIDFTSSKVSPYKRLRGGVHLVNVIPKNQMGKTLYKDVREAAVKLYKPPNRTSGKL